MMRIHGRSLISPILIVLFGAVSVSPLLQQRMTCSDDGAFGIHKGLGLELAIQLGHWFPRWSPHMAHGFGYPLYNFYAPLGSYLLAGIHSLGFIYPAALHIAFGISIILSGIAVYALVERWWGAKAGVTAGVIYLTSPYLAFNILFRAALSETLALVWLPLILWTYDKALCRGEPRWIALASISSAGLVYTHNATALLASPLILSYSVLLSWDRKSWRVLARAAIVTLSGLMLSAHFWIPALSEQVLIQTENLLTPPIFTYYTNFLTPVELLALPTATQTNLLNPSPPKAIGATLAGLALIGFATILLVRKREGPENNSGAPPPHPTSHSPALLLVFFSVTLIGYAFLTLSYSRPLWEALPLLPFVQFPWRMLGIATLCASVLAGASVRWFAGFHNAWPATVFIAALAVLGQISWWYPRYCANFQEATVTTMLQYEYDTFTVGTSAKGEFLPRAVQSMPVDNTLTEAIQRGENPNRLRGLPETATLTILDTDPLSFRAHVTTAEAFTATYQMFYYLGWRVTIDGYQTTLQVTPNTGLIKFEVPPGHHDIHVFFGTTPLRSLASLLSIITLLGLIVIITLPRSAASEEPRRHNPAPALLLFVPIAILAAKIFFIDRTDNPIHRTNVQVETLGTPIHLSLDNGLDTLAYDIIPNPVLSGNSFEVILYLTPRHPPGRDFRPVFRLESADGQIWNLNPHETLPPRWHREPPRTQYWSPGKYGQFARLYQLLPGTPPGEYQLSATFFDYETLETSKIMTLEGGTRSDRIDLGTLTVVRPSIPASPAELEMQINTQARVGSGVSLLGFSSDREQANPGDLMSVTLFFEADHTPINHGQFTLGLHGTDFHLRLTPTPGFPTTQWRLGDVWRGQHLVQLPANLPAGKYRWMILGDTNRASYVGLLHVISPERTFEAPDVVHRTRLAFGPDVLLAGYEWDQQNIRPKDVINVLLVWQALTTPVEDLSAFLHLETPNGELVAQHDGVPANWTRPSTGWLSGEFVSDLHSLTVPDGVPAGTYQLYVGLADRASGVRLPVVDDEGQSYDNRALIGLLTVIP